MVFEKISPKFAELIFGAFLSPGHSNDHESDLGYAPWTYPKVCQIFRMSIGNASILLGLLICVL